MSRPQTATHAVQLPESGLAEWYHLVPAGTFRGRDGRGPYALMNAEAVIAASVAYAAGADPVVDYGHQTLDERQKSGPVPAAGWIKAFEAREDGIWARIEWTEMASAHLLAREYRYLSPVFTYDPTTGAVVLITMAALTNMPNLQLQAAASQGDSMDELLERLRYLLNLPLTATPEEIASHLEKLKAMVSGAEATAAASAQMAKALGLAENAELPALATALHARLEQTPDPTQWVPKAIHDQVAHSLATLQASTQSATVQQLVQEAMSAGKVPPAQVSWATDYAMKDLEGFKAYLASAPVIATAHSAVSTRTHTGTPVLNPDQEAMCRMFGHEPSSIATAMKED